MREKHRHPGFGQQLNNLQAPVNGENHLHPPEKQLLSE